ncbi:MAG: site-2 protease family protein [Anaerolineaceae bacterium]|nr:site-2 protease family protein [Anaerolineaceae bacterium]MCY3907670.1 site-2 protease family protein [Anaerolineaceae bacterium]
MLLLGNLSLEGILGAIVAVGLGMTVHEFAHNYIAHRMGDPVPAQQGRLTLNPLVHINWLGWLMFALLGFGILGSAPISPQRMRNPRYGFLAAVAAGPLANLLLALLFALLYQMMEPLLRSGALPLALVRPVATMIWTIVFINVLLCLFNLLPLFPLDGWHMVYALLPAQQAWTWGSAQWRQYSQYAFFALILLSFSGIFNLFGMLISGPAFRFTRLLLG